MEQEDTNNTNLSINKSIEIFLRNELLFEFLETYYQSYDGSCLLKARQNDKNLSIICFSINDDSKDSFNIEQKRQIYKYCDILQESKHPYILRCLNVYILPNSIVIVFDPFDYSMRKWNQSHLQDRVIEVIIIKYALQLLQVIQFLHNQNQVLHQLSLDKILLDSHNDIKIYKFGQSTLVKPQLFLEQNNSYPNLQTIILPPESLTHKNNQIPQDYYETFSSNIWDFGICLYQMAGATNKDIEQILGQDQLFNKKECLGDKLNSIIEQILNQNPNRRPKVEDLIQFFQDLKQSLWNKQTTENIYNHICESDEIESQIAIQFLQICIEIDPKESKFYLKQAYYQKKLGQFEEMFKCIHQLIRDIYPQLMQQPNLSYNDGNLVDEYLQDYQKINPQNQECTYLRARINYVQDINLEQCYSSLKNLLNSEQEYKNEEVYLLLGLVSLKLKKFEEAFLFLDKYQKIFPNDYQSYLSLGMYYREKGEIDLSKSFLEKSITLNTQFNNAVAYCQLGALSYIYYIDESLPYFQKSLIEDPQYHESLYRIGICYYDESNYEEAINYFKQALEIKPQSIEYISNLASAYYKMERYQESLDSYLSIYFMDKKNEIGLSGVSILYRKLNQFELAINFAENLIKLYPQNIQYIQDYTSLLLKIESYNEAITFLQNQVESNPLDSRLHEELGLLYQKIKQNNKAIEQFKESLKLNQQNSKCFQSLAKSYYEQGQVNEAIENYEKGLGLKPNDPTSLLSLGIIYFKMGQFNQAKELLEQIKKPIQKQNYRYLLYLFSCYKKNNEEEKLQQCITDILKQDNISYHEIGNKFNKEKLYDEAIYFFEKDLETNPSNDKSYMNLGNSYRKKKQMNKAMDYFKKCLELNPQNTTCYMNLGILYQEQNMYEEAIEAFNNCIQLDSGDYDCYYNMGVVFNLMKDQEKALQQYLKCFELNQKDKECLKNIGNIYYDRTAYEGAEYYYRKYLELEPYNFTILYNLGNCYKQLRQYEKAIFNYKQSLQINPQNSLCYMKLGATYKKIQEYDLAEEYLKKCLEINPNFAECYENLGLVYKKAKKYRQAIEAYKKSIEIEPNHNTYLNLGNAYVSCYQIDEGISCYQQCLKMNPNDGLGYQNLGITYSKKGMSNKAIKSFLKSVELEPNNDDFLLDLGLEYEKTCQFKNSLKIFNKIYEIGSVNQYVSLLQSGMIYLNLGMYDKAIQQFTECQNEENDIGESLMYLGNACQDLGNIDKAIEYYEESINYDNSISTCIYLGNAYYQKRDYQNFIDQYSQLEYAARDNILSMNKKIALSKQKQLDMLNQND